MIQKMHVTAVRTTNDNNARGKLMLWLFATRTRIVSAIDIPDKNVSGFFLEPGLCVKYGDWIDPETQTFKYLHGTHHHLNSVPREMVLFANIRMLEEDGELKLVVDQAQWKDIKETWKTSMSNSLDSA
jgi:hypothetical protein